LPSWVSDAVTLVHDNAGMTPGVMCLFGCPIDPRAKAGGLVVLAVDRWPFNDWYPQVAAIGCCSCGDAFAGETFGGEVVGDEALKGAALGFLRVAHGSEIEAM
jgi:hypothetical protein